VLLLIVGSLGVLVGLALLITGGFALWADQTERDDDGYLTTPTETFSTARYALTAEGLDVNAEGFDWATDSDRFGRIKIEASSNDGRPLFVGIGPQSAVSGYLRGVSHDEVENVNFGPWDWVDDDFSVDYDASPGGPPRADPAAQGFWAARASGSQDETLTWDVESGDWSVVVMNADASRGVDADVALGARLGFLLWLAVGLLIAGAVILIGSVFLIYLAARERSAA
jgi:hypothetical protein